MTDISTTSTSPAAPPAPAIADDTTLGTVSLTVSDIDRSRAFYERVLGLRCAETDDGAFVFGVPDRPALVQLRGDAGARPLDRRATGLYHLAILFPSRLDLAHALLRLAEARWPLDGVADHLVSEALYLSDPDGNGIELYRDRPRTEWRYDGGELQMATLPLDLQNLAGELSRAETRPDGAPAGTTIGHVHLQVADIPAVEAFYHEVLGFGVMARSYPGALFVSAGGYHHHLGLNTWHSRGSAAAPPGSVGLRSYEIVLPDAAELSRVLERVRAAGIEIQAAPGAATPDGGAASVRDPAGNLVVLRCR